jgi:hypothetical protein
MTVSSSRTLRWGSALALLLGALGFGMAVTHGAAPRAWEAFLVNLLFWLGIAQGGVVVSASLYLTQARWGGAGTYRLAESFAGFLPLGMLLFWVLFPGRAVLFPWVRHPLPEKAAWLNVPFLFGRDGAGLLIMTALSLWFVRVSRHDDVVDWAEATDNIELPPPVIRRLAPAVVITYAVVYSVLAFDLVMSLSPLWYSTLFGAYFFAGAYWSALAAIGALVSLGWHPRPRNGSDDRGLLHDVGKLVFAFSIFWTYLLWSQYLPIWYAGLPEETFFVVQRVHRMPWEALAWSVLILVWVIPFISLLSRQAKRHPQVLGTVCVLGLIGMWLERYVLVTPSLSSTQIPFGWVEILVTAGFAGLFVLSTLPGLQLARAPLGGGRG